MVIKNILIDIAQQIIEEIREKPFFLVTEADVLGYLYSQLTKKKELSDTFKDCTGKENHRIHLEYPRYRIKDKKLKFLGRYDMVILKEPKDTFFENNDACEEKPIWVGFEIKLNWNEEEDIVIENIKSDLPAFLKKEDRLNADIGVIFHLNVAKSSTNNLKKIEDKINKFTIDYPHVYFIYMESYRCKKLLPNTISNISMT